MVEMPDTGVSLSSACLGMLAKLTSPSDQSPEAEFLRSRAGANIHSKSDHVLQALGEELGLTRVELLVTALAAAVETDLMCGRAIAHLQAPIGGSRPTLGLLATAMREFGDEGAIISVILMGAAVESGLLLVASEGAPLAERALSMPVFLCLALEGRDGYEKAWPGAALAKNQADDLPLPLSAVAAAKRYALGLSKGNNKAIVLRSGSLAEAKAVSAEIARRLGRQALFIDAEKYRGAQVSGGLAPFLYLRLLAPVFCFELGPGERRALPSIPRYHGARIAICGPDGSLESDAETVPGWTIPIASKGERVRLWGMALGGAARGVSPLARHLASHRHGSGRIAQLGRLARHQSVLNGRTRPLLKDIAAAAWTAEGSGLEALAQPMPDEIPDEALVMTPGLRNELNRLLLRCRSREELVEGLGPSASAKYWPGVRALFTGPSGTGKTLAAGWLATRLGLPLYRVDLAAVNSKFIGETEKNLAQLLARAENSEVILLFDEADSMFGKRTDIMESNDRFANAQTNYLLQRIERFDGIVVLTSNSRARFDPAFFRRLDAIVEFPVPGPEERRALWQSHLGSDHLLDGRELNLLSASADLLGGNIRNAVLTGAMLAKGENRRLAYADILSAVSDEYRKLGKQLPAGLRSV